ncbi:hypothetical protein RJ640_019287 [Escallonia rubra]|uniref:RING-type E3 ubiquitin transferase n=1 Tax=Escallonia rubra TaxID=112253 RepID=A0AA88UWE6_9ASTE|nr:hypothetical protein RJ640_019287 [Escallonia rubra]
MGVWKNVFSDEFQPSLGSIDSELQLMFGTGLLFLHHTKPEPLVHRDLKPANILLDRNYVSKISNVGLARLVPPSVADNVTQYRMTSTVGTFCYIDPEYQQTGMLGIKSDIYSLGIMFLQMITAKPPMGLTHHVEKAIEGGSFAEMLDQTLPDWPVEKELSFANMARKCAELRRKGRNREANNRVTYLCSIPKSCQVAVAHLHLIPIAESVARVHSRNLHDATTYNASLVHQVLSGE